MQGVKCCAVAGLLLLLCAPAQAQSVRRDATVRAVEAVGPAVANISTEEIVERGSGHVGPSLQEWLGKKGRAPRRHRVASSLGSGVVVSADGYILTNAHVVARASRILVTLPGLETMEARLLSIHHSEDLALLSVEPKKPLTAVRLEEPDDLMIGETVIALGNPFGLENSVTRGVLSARGRKLKLGGQRLPGRFLQTDAAINPGNSGGPLINLDAKLIGLNTAVQQGGTGIGFAIPVSRIRKALIQLSDPLLLRELYLGVELADAPRGSGAEVVAVEPGGPAWRAGIRKGDRIVASGPEPVRSAFGFNATFVPPAVTSRRLAVVDGRGKRRGAVLAGVEPPYRATLRRRLGITAQDVTPALAWRIGFEGRGVLVQEVSPGSPAARLGLESGDVITRAARRLPGKRLERHELKGQRSLASFLGRVESGEQVAITVRRNGKDFWGELRPK